MDRRLSIIPEDSSFESIMEEIGANGLFQKRFNFLFVFMLIVATTFPYFNIILSLSVPDHWCYVPGRNETNFTIEEWKNLTLPKKANSKGLDGPHNCKMYNVTSKEILSGGVDRYASNRIEIDCEHGWEYDETWYTRTVSSQENWVCDKELLVTNAFSFIRLGDVIGTLTFGQLSDAIGRRPAYYLAMVTLIVGRMLTTLFSHNYYLLLMTIVLGSFACTAVFQSPLIIAMEISDDESRGNIALIQGLGWTTGTCVLPFVFWALGDWLPFMIATTVPCIVFFFFYKYMIESPRWLATKGKIRQCIDVLEKIAVSNGTVVPDDAILILKKKLNQTERAYGVLALFSSWRLAKNTILLIIVWVNGAVAYYSILLNVNSLGGNPFMNYFWQGLAEYPAYICGRISSDKIGRRLTQILPFLAGTATCVMMTSFANDPDKEVLISVLAAVVKFFISFVFYATNLQTLEIFPTCVRQSGLALCAISASGFGIFAPYIIYLGTTYDVRLPYVILTLLMLFGALSSFFLPETFHEKLPETLAEAHVFGARQKYFELPRKFISIHQ